MLHSPFGARSSPITCIEAKVKSEHVKRAQQRNSSASSSIPIASKLKTKHVKKTPKVGTKSAVAAVSSKIKTHVKKATVIGISANYSCCKGNANNTHQEKMPVMTRDIDSASASKIKTHVKNVSKVRTNLVIATAWKTSRGNANNTHQEKMPVMTMDIDSASASKIKTHVKNVPKVRTNPVIATAWETSKQNANNTHQEKRPIITTTVDGALANKSSKDLQFRKVRGVTVGHKLLIPSLNQKFYVEFNEEGQPIRDMSRDLVLWLGTYARNGSYFPLPYKDWRHVPGVRKDDVWKLIEDIYEFDDPPTEQRWIFMSLGHKWHDFKVRLKKRRYDVHDSDVARIKDWDPRVDKSRWRKLIAYWGTKAAKMLSKRNKVSRSKVDMLHSCGTKSTARYRDEETKKRSDGTIPRRDEIFVITHTRKNKEYTDSASTEKAEKLLDLASSKADSLESCSVSKNDVYSQIIGPNKQGFVRGMGLGVTPSQLWGTSVPTRAKRREAELVRENKKLRTKVKLLEERQETMQAELTEVKMMIQQLTNGIRSGDNQIATSHVDSSEGGHEEEDEELTGDDHEEVEEDEDSSGDGDSSEDE